MADFCCKIKMDLLKCPHLHFPDLDEEPRQVDIRQQLTLSQGYIFYVENDIPPPFGDHIFPPFIYRICNSIKINTFLSFCSRF